MKKQYDAFISYKHVTSTGFSKDFEIDLKRFARSRFSKPRTLFRDEQYLKPGQPLGPAIREALIDSKYLVLLATPDAATSNWVQEELTIWCEELKRTDRLLIVLLEGSIGLDSSERALDWQSTTSLPLLLKGHLEELPIWIDLTSTKHKNERRLENPDYQHAVAGVVAVIENTDPNTLIGREWRIRRNMLVAAWAGVLIMALLVVSLGVTGLFLNYSLETARSQELAARSRLMARGARLETAVHAVSEKQTTEAVRALLDAHVSTRSMLWERQLNDDTIESLGFSHSRPVAVVDDVVVDVQDGNVLAKDVQMVDASPNGTLWYSSNTLRAEGYPATNLSQKITALSAADDLVAVALANGEVAYRTPHNPELTMLFKYRAIGADVHTAAGWIVSAVLDSSAPVELWHADHGLLQLPDPPFSANAAAVSPNGAYMSVAFEDGSVGIWSLPGLERLQLARLDQSASATAWRNDSAAVAFGTADGSVVVLDTGFDLLDEMEAANGGVWSMVWQGKELFTTGSDGAVRAWVPGQTVGPIQRHAGDASSRASIVEQKLGQPGIRRTQEDIQLVDGDWESPLVGIPPGCRLYGAQVSPKKRYALLNWWPKPNREANCHAIIYDIKKGEVQILPSVPEWVQSFAFHDESQVVVTGSAALGAGVRLAIWQLSEGASPSLIHDEVMQRAPIQAVKFISSEKLVLGGLMGKILLYELNGRKIRSDAPVGAVRDIVVLQDGTLVSSDVDGVRWFEDDLTLRGVLLDTSGAHESVWSLQELASEQALQAVTQTGDRLIISLKVEDWKSAAEKKYQSH